MSIPEQTEDRPLCEVMLIESRRDNPLPGIALRERAFVDRLIARGDELRVVYEEIHEKLQAHPCAIRCLLGSIVRAAVLCCGIVALRERDSRNPAALSVEGRGNSGSVADALRADLGKAIFAAIEQNSVLNGGLLPAGFMLSDSAVGILAKCVLDTTPHYLATRLANV